MALPSIGRTGTLLNGFTIGGNNLSGDQKILLSAVELEIERILMNDNYTTFNRFSETASQQIDLGGAGVAIYTKTERVVWGSDYNEIIGSEIQVGSARRLQVNLDQFLSIKFIIPDFDYQRLRNNPRIAAGLAAEWNASLVINKLMELELIHLNAIVLYCIYRYQFDKSSILVLDLSPEAIKDQQSAENAFYKIGNHMIDKITQVTKTEVGTNQSDWDGWFEPRAWLNLSRVYTKLIATETAANVLATGDLYRDQILGTSVGQHYYLGKIFAPGTETAMNKDVRWDLRGVQAFFGHRKVEAFPMSFEKFQLVIDNETLNLKFIGKIMFGLPAFIRGNLLFTIMQNEPTQKQIDYANSMVYKPNSGGGDYNDNLKYAFQLTSEDLIMQQGINDDGTTNIYLTLDRDDDYKIGQAMVQMDLQPNEWIVIAKEDPSLKAGDKKTDEEIKAIPSEEWKDVKDGTKYWFIVFKNTEDTNEVVSVNNVVVVNKDLWNSTIKSTAKKTVAVKK